jgi:hypothetical protein
MIKKGSPTGPMATREVAQERIDPSPNPRVKVRARRTTKRAAAARRSDTFTTMHGTVARRKPAALDGFAGPWKLDVTHNAECLSAMKQIPTDSVDIAVKSPPYWGQRGNFGLGLEPDPRDDVRNLAVILAEVMRCLKPWGTLWLNVGDSYDTPINWREEDHEYSSLGKEGNGLPATNSAYTKQRGRRRAFIDIDVGWLHYGNLWGFLIALYWR